jgi:hypothetical protein
MRRDINEETTRASEQQLQSMQANSELSFGGSLLSAFAPQRLRRKRFYVVYEKTNKL